MAHRRSGAVLRRDHARPRTQPASLDPVIRDRLTLLVHPATLAVAEQYRRLGMRDRILTLPVMVSLLLAMIWRQIPSVSELARSLAREELLWTPPRRVSQQALSLRLRVLPTALMRAVVREVLPQLAARARRRTRPMPTAICRAQQSFARIWIADATTLEALFKKVGALREVEGTIRGGILFAVLDLATRLPVQLWWDQDASRSERSFLPQLQAALTERTLVLLDRGFYSFPLFDWFTIHGHGFITRTRSDAAFALVRVLVETDRVRDRIIQLGVYRSNPCVHPVRLVEIRVGERWYAYLTNVLDPQQLAAADIADLYGRRWRIEEAFALVKRLLGLSYLWTGAENGIALQVWSTWLLYGVLIDLCDSIAEVKGLPLDRISVEMVFRGLYHFTQAHARGEADDPVAYLASQQDLGIVKRLRQPTTRRERNTTLDSHRQILNL